MKTVQLRIVHAGIDDSDAARRGKAKRRDGRNRARVISAVSRRLRNYDPRGAKPHLDCTIGSDRRPGGPGSVGGRGDRHRGVVNVDVAVAGECRSLQARKAAVH